ncbi:hypothetical protein HK405_003811, partial [Cladochytrium tenue]
MAAVEVKDAVSTATPAGTATPALPPGVQGDSMHAATPIHYPRLFMYFALFLVPLMFSITYVAANAIYRVQMAAETASGIKELFSFTGYVGLFQLCTASTNDGCIGVVQLCNAASSANATAAAANGDWPLGVPPAVTDALCGATSKSAAAFGILGLAAGLLALLAYADNMLVWTNHSVLFRPKTHTVKQTLRVRTSFRVLVNWSVGAHAVLIAISLILIIQVRAGIIANGGANMPLTVDVFWGLIVGALACFIDVIFIVLFFFFDRYTFFAVPSG